MEPLGDWRRTHTCGALRAADVGREATLCGWVHRRRDHGGVIFADVRDRYGLTQVVVRPSEEPALESKAHDLRAEFVLAVRGVVEARPPDMRNPNLATGEVEVRALDIRILNRCLPPPFLIEDANEANDDLRLKYRFLDLRRPRMQRNLALRHRAILAARNYFDAHGFLEIETPLLVKSTPEGARDFVVPSRLMPGKFFALPQSPQLYKQILMVSGCDRYVQFAKCLRDEDLRADRQPEFTQIDLEMSFVGEEDVFRLVEGLMQAVFETALGVRLSTPFPRITYDQAIARYGSDKPDIRFGLEHRDLTELARRSTFDAFRAAVESGGLVKALAAPSEALSRKALAEIEASAKALGAGGLAWTRRTDAGLEGGIAKFFDGDAGAALADAAGAKPGETILAVAGPARVAHAALAAVRNELGARLGLVQADDFRFAWVHRFPLFERNDEGGFSPAHHMFTMPLDEHLDIIERDPERVRAVLYDLTLNGAEVASGSVRVHRPDIQRRIMNVVGIRGEEQDTRFGFLLSAFEYGAPPHGGIAIGVDRVVAMMAGETSIREVIAFPRTQKGSSPMDGSPSELEPRQLDELRIRVIDEA
jgi:aspartyl-tRNA synthetase